MSVEVRAPQEEENTCGAVDEARRIKPSIPLIGEQGIPIHDELEFEIVLEG